MDGPARRSPVRFEAEALRTVVRDDWTIVLEYAEQGDGPHLVDLSHLPRWDVQHTRLDEADLGNLAVPVQPGASFLRARILVNRMNRAQASVWHLHGEPVALPASEAFTDVTDATVFLGLVGAGALRVAERLSNLDFGQPDRAPPFLLQGPFSHVPCQIAIMGTSGAGAGLLLTCARGYARDLVAAILHAGAPEGLRPAGESSIARWLG